MTSASDRMDRIDRAWFSRRPTKWIRARKASADEVAERETPAAGKSWFVIVAKDGSGRIVRHFIMAFTMPEDTNTLAVTADLIAEAAENSSDITPDMIARGNDRLTALNKSRNELKRRGVRL